MSQLRVAILHYHMRGGGVTHIVKQMQLWLPKDKVKLALITGEPTENGIDLPSAFIEGLSYGKNETKLDAKEAKRRILEEAKGLLGGEVDVFHVHNYSLGKNPVYTEAILQLAEEGYPTLLHLHDFCEDYRPQNYQLLKSYTRSSSKSSLVEQLYPISKHIHYAVLNARDYSYLQQLGIPEAQLHLLANPVVSPLNEGLEEETTSLPFEYILYPVRAIPRKNVAEALFWASHPEETYHYGVTLAPKNEQYRTNYEAIKGFALQNNINLSFEVGQIWDLSFSNLMKKASAIISTSMIEGFGLAYLESWLSGKPLIGRKLPSIMADFETNGIHFPDLYTKLEIPKELLDIRNLKAKMLAYASAAFEAYGIPEANLHAESLILKLIESEKIDFGILDFGSQLELLRTLFNEPTIFREIAPKPLSDTIASKEVIKHNQELISNVYNAEVFADKLIHIYRQLLTTKTDISGYLSAQNLVPLFLQPEGFSLIR